MPRTTRKEREDRRRHALEIVSGGYGWGDATKIIENTYKVSRRTAIRDVDLAFEGIVQTLDKSDIKSLMGWITLGVQRNIMKAENQNNIGAAISGYNLLHIFYIYKNLVIVSIYKTFTYISITTVSQTVPQPIFETSLLV